MSFLYDHLEEDHLMNMINHVIYYIILGNI